MKLSKPIKRVITIIILLYLLFLIWFYNFGPGIEIIENFEELYSPSASWDPATVNYEIISISPQFQEYWAKPETYILASPGEKCNLFALQNKLIFEASFDQYEFLSLNQADLETGEIVWQVALTPEGPDVMTHNENIIFHGSGIPGKISAYDIESGNQIWEHILSRQEKNIIKYLYATEKQLFVNSSSYNFNLFNAVTGEHQNWDSQLDVFPIFFIDENVIYHRKIDTHLLASDKTNGNTLWDISLNEPVQISPLFTDDLVIVRTGEYNSGQILAINRDNGTILWQRPPGPIDWENPANVMGTVAEDNGYVFYLTSDGHLEAANTKTGELAGVVKIEPSFEELDGHDRVNREFCVAASNNIVVVYLGSGRQLFAFRFQPGFGKDTQNK